MKRGRDSSLLALRDHQGCLVKVPWGKGYKSYKGKYIKDDNGQKSQHKALTRGYLISFPFVPTVLRSFLRMEADSYTHTPAGQI